MTRRYKMVTIYSVWVNGRCFQTTEKEERRDELMELLPQFYPGAEISWEAKKERRYY